MPTPCTHFRPSTTNAALCRWWIEPPASIPDNWIPFCASSLKLDKACETKGRNPQEQEEEPSVGWVTQRRLRGFF